MHSKTLRDWTAKRSSSHVAIIGINVDTGKEDRINAKELRPGAPIKRPAGMFSSGRALWATNIATDADGVAHTLLIPVD